MANEKRLAALVKEAMAEALKVYDADDYEEIAEWIANWLELNWVTIQKNPTVDAVEVVRCKDCKHNVANKEYDPLDVTDYTDIVCDYWMNDGNLADDFCSYGERKDNE